jgi:6-pyruvoyltetrahydropterin/6-carboxytetrahydropterin synthase|tara:strand:- start:9866 stop:10258 length:393 start_codon:yes stop_codon:yes gene_type:complete
MKVSKTFTWDMAHRLTFHKGKCFNLHGHTYSATFYFENEPDENGIVIDYYDIKKEVAPLIEELDHSFMIYTKDKLLPLVKDKGLKIIECGFETTAENIAIYFYKQLKDKLPITEVIVRETPNTNAIYNEH